MFGMGIGECIQCRQEILEADRDHLLAVHPKTVQPETLTVRLRHCVATEGRRPQR